MNLLTTSLIGASLAMDCFAIAVCISAIRKVKFSDYFLVSGHFGAFHVIMPIIGFYIGKYFDTIITNYDHWIAFVLLSYIGIKMIVGFFKKSGQKKEVHFKNETELLLLSLAVSIDALIIGVTFGFSETTILAPALIIGFFALLITSIGLLIGEKIYEMKFRYAEIIGGLVLIGIGLKTLISHLIK